jgi:hypothetical protein
MFADLPSTIPPSSASLMVQLFGLLAFAVALGVGLVTIWRGVRKDRVEATILPDPLTIRHQTEFASKKDLENLTKRVADLDGDLRRLGDRIVENGETRRQRVQDSLESLRRELGLDIGKVHERIDVESKATSGLAAQLTLLNQYLVRLDQQQQHLAEKGRAS